MRESIGGSVLFMIIIGFIVLYIFFMGFIMKYAIASRANNYVITAIEQYEGRFNERENPFANVKEKLKKMGYDADKIYVESNPVTVNNSFIGCVYTVVTPMEFTIPLIDFKFYPTIRNETKTIYSVECKNIS